MNNAIKISAIALAALLAAGCSNHNKEFDQRITAAQNSADRAQDRADAAYTKANDAFALAQQATQTAEDANEAAMRMLQRSSRK